MNTHQNWLLLFTAVALVATARATESARAFELLDLNSDGKITEDEAGRSPWGNRLDSDGDGAVSEPELAAGWDKHPALRAALATRFPQIMGFETPKPAEPASPRESFKPLKPAEHKIGALIPDLEITVPGGKKSRLSAIAAGKPLVIAGVSTSCPVSKRYLPVLAALEKEHGQRAAFLFVATTGTDSDAELAAAGFAAPILRDATLLKTLGALSKTDCFVLDAARTLQYRGAVDDQYGLGYSLDAPRAKLLATALGDILAGRRPTVQATSAPGCDLDLSETREAAAGEVTFHNRISRILQQSCLECHHPGGVAPFALETFAEVKEHAGMIRKMVDQRLMPPWFAAPGHGTWANDRSLSERDRADLLGWLAAGKPEGDAKDAPLKMTFGEGEWAIGKPDAILQIPEPIAVKATGTMPYQTARVPTNFTETRWVSAVEVLPTARDVVHHVLVFADEPSAGRIRNILRRAGGDFRSGGDDDESGGFFAIYVPGNNTLTYPDGFAKALPAGATLRFQIHYTPNGREVREQVRIGLKFAPGKPRHEVHNTGISTHRFSIPPGAPNHRVDAHLRVPRDATVLAFLPHMHVRGKAWRYSLRSPDGAEKTLLDIPRYDFNWQLLYRYAEPLQISAGSTILTSAWYDNSPANPANPDPSATVKWGPQTSDEMMLGYVEYYLPGN